MTIDTGSVTAKYVITDKDDNMLKFNSDGYLKTIEDRNGNTNSITWSSNKISGITDGAGRTYSLYYSSSLLSSISAPGGRVIEYVYYG